MEFNNFKEALFHEMERNGDSFVDLEIKSPFALLEDGLHWLEANNEQWDFLDETTRWDFQAFAYSEKFVYCCFWSHDAGDLICQSVRKATSTKTERVLLND